MNGVQTRFKCKLDVKRCKRFVFPPSSLLPRSNALKTKAIRYFQTDRTLTRIVSPPLIELGIPGKDAMQMAAYSMEGATELILNHNTHPLLEIEKVTTPGGTTIKGLNELEHKGFTSSIIQAIKSSATTLIDKEEEDAKNFR